MCICQLSAFVCVCERQVVEGLVSLYCLSSSFFFNTSLFFPSFCCYWRSSPSSSSWMTWMSSDGEVGRLAGRLSGCCCLPSSLLFSSSSMVFFQTLWFSVRCCMMLQNSLRRPFLLSVNKQRNVSEKKSRSAHWKPVAYDKLLVSHLVPAHPLAHHPHPRLHRCPCPPAPHPHLHLIPPRWSSGQAVGRQHRRSYKVVLQCEWWRTPVALPAAGRSDPWRGWWVIPT